MPEIAGILAERARWPLLVFFGACQGRIGIVTEVIPGPVVLDGVASAN
jgi:hypothetical protein